MREGDEAEESDVEGDNSGTVRSCFVYKVPGSLNLSTPWKSHKLVIY